MATIHYRYCSRDAATIASPTLYEAIETIMGERTQDGKLVRMSIGARRQPTNDAHEVVVSIYTRTRDWVFVELLRAEPGAFLITVQDDGNDETVSIRQYQSPDNQPPHRGSLYAMIRGDHVLFATKGYFSSSCLESYLTWFCRKSDAVLADDRRVTLATRTPNVQSLRVNTVRLSMNPIVPDDFGQGDDDEVRARRPTSQGLLDTLLVTDADLRRLVEDGELEIDVLLRFKSGRRRRDMAVGDLDHIFRNIDDVDDLSFDGPNGPINALGARLQGRKSIAASGTLYDTTDARRKLVEQFEEWVEQGLIVDDAV